MKSQLRTLCCLIVCLFTPFLGLVLPFYGQAPTGDISGTVFDETGAVVPGVLITITNLATGLTRTFTTGPTGIYSATSIPAGVYEVKAEVTGFRTLLRQATVETGTVTTVDLHLQIGATKDIVTVDAAAPQVDYDRHTIGGVVNREQIQNLPLNGRSFLQLAFLEPGVTVSAGAQGQYNRAFDVSVLGGDSGTTRITVDGANIRDPVDGGTQQNFSQEIVQEFQVSSINFDLSTGICGSGAINVVTRSGSNDFHGSGFFFFRDHNMSAYPGLQRYANDPNPFFARRQPGFWFGGPVKKDKLFFFVNYEHTNQKGVFDTVPSDAALQGLATLTESPFNENLVGVRLDYRLNDKNNFFVRYSHDGNTSFAPRSTGDLPSAWVSNWNYADSGVASLITSFSPRIVNEFRYSLSFWDNKNTTPTAAQCPNCLDLGGPYISIQGTGLGMGNQTNTPQSRILRRHIFADNVTWQLGAHRMKFGGEWEHQKGTGTYTIDEPAAITLFSPEEVRQLTPQLTPLLPTSFSTLQNILRLPLANFQFGFGNTQQPPPFQMGRADHDNTFHLYWEDSWKVKPSFTLNYGLAWTYESNVLNHDIPKPQWLAPFYPSGALGPELHAPLRFSPMLGFAWAVTKDSKTVVRGGAGIYYDTIDLTLRLIERNYIGPLGAGYVTLPGSLIPNPIPGVPGVPVGQTLNFTSPTAFSGNLLYAILPQIRQQSMQLVPTNPNNTDLSLTTIDLFKTGTGLFTHNFVPPTSQHASLGIQRQLSTDFAITADFVYRHYVHLTNESLDANHFYEYVNRVQTPVLPVCPAALQLVPKAPCSNGEVQITNSDGTSRYMALLVKLDKRFAQRYQLQASYALQAQDGINGIYNLQNWNQYYGPQGPRQILNVSGVVNLPWNFQISFISSYSSRTPFQPVIPGIDLTGSGVTGFPLPGMGSSLFNAGLGQGDLIKLVNQYNQTYAGNPGPVPGQVFPKINLPQNYNLGKNFNSQDLRLTKTFRFRERYELQIFGEGFNIFNIANLSGYDTNLLDSTFGQPTARAGNIFGTGGPRAFQIGSRFSF